MRVLTDADVAAAMDLGALLVPVADALRAQRDGRVERPERPHFPVGVGLDGGADDADTTDPAGTALTMPAYVHGADRYATKLVSVHEGNADRGLPTVRAQIAVTDAATGRPEAFLAGTRVTNARTGCVGGLAVRHLADPPVEVGILGAGTQARWQARAIDAATDLAGLRVYSPSDSRGRCARDLRSRGIEARAVETPRAAVSGADAVVTATTATEPVFPGEALSPGAVVVAVGAYTPEMRELDDATLDRAAVVYADVPEEAAAVGDLAGRYDAHDLAPIADAFESVPADRRPEGAEVVVVESVGSAVMDAAAAEFVLDRVERGEGGEAGGGDGDGTAGVGPDGAGGGIEVDLEAGPGSGDG